MIRIRVLLNKSGMLLFTLLQLIQIARINCEHEPGQKDESSRFRKLEEDKGYITSGTYREKIPSPVFYETFIPLIYEFTTPTWNKTDLAFNNWYTCVTETAPYRFSCPIAFHMNKAIINLHTDFESLTPTQDTSDNSEYFSILSSRSNFCDKIQKHFNSHVIRKEELVDYIGSIVACKSLTTLSDLVNATDFEKTISKFTYNVREPFTKMENNFYNTFYRGILNSSNNNTNLDRVASSVLSNSRIALQGSYLSFYYAERHRWSHAEMSCSSQLIPLSLISRDDFDEVLSKIVNTSSFSSNYDLSINKSSFSKYYTLPLTDCTHTSNTFVVRILIPIIKRLRGKILRLVQLHNPPFLYKNNLCSLHLESGKFYIFNELASSAFPTNCVSNELCSISDYSMLTNVRDPCASAILSQNYIDTRNHCDFKCIPLVKDSSTQQSYIVHRVSSSKYVLTKTAELPSRLHIQCQNMPPSDYDFDQPIGAYLVTLPCKCQIVLPSQQILYSDLPCDQEYTSIKIRWIVPIHFINQTKFHPNENDATTISDLDNENQGEIETFDLSNIIDREVLNNFVANTRNEKVHHIKSDTLNSQHGIPVPGHSGNEVLWAVFTVVACIIIAIQIYIIFELRRVKQISYPKDERILFRVPESPRLDHI